MRGYAREYVRGPGRRNTRSFPPRSGYDRSFRHFRGENYDRGGRGPISSGTPVSRYPGDYSLGRAGDYGMRFRQGYELRGGFGYADERGRGLHRWSGRTHGPPYQGHVRE